MNRKLVGTGLMFAAAAALAIPACSGGGYGGGTPTEPTPPPGGGTGAMTITIGANGAVLPTTLTVPVGSRVTFVNNHDRPHDMSSDPHPDHTDCPEVTVGNLQPGQTRPTQNLTTARTCGFHDHNEPSNTALNGTIRIQ
ncbi:MAG: cupredoxin domain-containing protein [Vicinamibacterales bacterium]